MKYKCPYCHCVLPDPPSATCPDCKKAMNLPNALRGKESRKRKQALDRIHKDGLRELRRMGADEERRGGRSGRLLFVIFVLVAAGILLVSQAFKLEHSSKSYEPEAIAARELTAMRVALEHYHRDCGRYPDATSGLALLVADTNSAGWDGPYIILLKNDPWRSAYQYTLSATNVILFSRGPDGRSGSSDDLHTPTNWVSHDALL